MAKSTGRQLQIREARERADLARMRFANSLSNARERLSPARLKQDAVVAAGDKVADVRKSVRSQLFRHPVLAAAAAASGVALLFWKPARKVALVGLRAGRIIWVNRQLWSSIRDR